MQLKLGAKVTRCGPWLHMRMRAIASATQLPALVSVLLAMCAWSVAHIVDRVLSSPIAEYSVSPATGADGTTKLEVKFANLSADKEFRNVTVFLVRRPEDAALKFVSFNMRPRAPFYVELQASKPSVNPDSVKVTIASWPPGAEWVLEGSYVGSGIPVVQYHAPDAPIVLRERSLETIIVRNELCILISLTVLWALIVVFLLSFNSSSGPRAEEANNVPPADAST